MSRYTPGDKAKYRRLRAHGVSHREALAQSASTPSPDFGPARAHGRASRVGNYVVPASFTVFPVPINTEVDDSHAFWDAANPERLTVPAGLDGLYLVVGQILYINTDTTNNTGVTGVRSTLLYKNGTVVADIPGRGNAGDHTAVAATTTLSLVAGDYVDLRGWSAHANISVRGDSSGATTWFSLTRLSG